MESPDLDQLPPDLAALNACAECGYGLTGLPSSGNCPECGCPYEGGRVVLHGWARGDKANLWNAAPASLATWALAYTAAGLYMMVAYRGGGSVIWWLGLTALAAAGAPIAVRLLLPRVGGARVVITARGCGQGDAGDYERVKSALGAVAAGLSMLILLGFALRARFPYELSWLAYFVPPAVGATILLIWLGVQAARRHRLPQPDPATAGQPRSRPVSPLVHSSCRWGDVGQVLLRRTWGGRYRLRVRPKPRGVFLDPGAVPAIDAELALSAEQADGLLSFIRQRTTDPRRRVVAAETPDRARADAHDSPS